MADYRAVPAVTEAVIELLQSCFQVAPEYFNNELEFKIYLAKVFAQPMAAGVSLFLYRIYPNGALRSPRGRPGPKGQQYRNQLPLDQQRRRHPDHQPNPSRQMAVRPEGANHQWRRNPPRELSIDLVADERLHDGQGADAAGGGPAACLPRAPDADGRAGEARQPDQGTAASEDLRRKRQQLLSFLLRHGRIYPQLLDIEDAGAVQPLLHARADAVDVLQFEAKQNARQVVLGDDDKAVRLLQVGTDGESTNFRFLARIIRLRVG